MTWADAMGLVVLEGLVILVLVLTGFREAVFHAVPAQLKVAISVGIGLFIALIGFVDAGFVRRIPDVAQTTVPVQLGQTGQLAGWPVLVFVARAAAADRALGAPGAGRDPDLDPGHHRRWRWSSRPRRPRRGRTADRLVADVPALPDDSGRRPRLRHARASSTCSAPSTGPVSSSPSCSSSRCCSPTSSTRWAR